MTDPAENIFNIVIVHHTRLHSGVRLMEKFVWSCTKFLAALLCAFCLSTLLILAGLVVLGYVSFIGGLFCAVWIYSKEIFPVLHKDELE